MRKPHIRMESGRYVCTGRWVSIDGVTASGAWIAWARYAALQVICHMEVA